MINPWKENENLESGLANGGPEINFFFVCSLFYKVHDYMSCKFSHDIWAKSDRLSGSLLILGPDYVTITSEVSHIYHGSAG